MGARSASSSENTAFIKPVIDRRRFSQEKMVEPSQRSLRVDNVEREEVLKAALDNEANRRWEMKRR
jgi:hypothetical protein